MAADVSSNLASWSASEGSNSPAGTTAISTNLDDNLRQIQATVRTYLATKASDIASATTTDLSTVAGSFVDVTGTTTITGFGTLSAGMSKVVQFDGALTLTHNATSLILPGGANITTAAGDCLYAISLGSGNWIVPFYQKASGGPVGPFKDDVAHVVGSSDGTKKVRDEVDTLISTATTRVRTNQDRNITIADILDTHGRCRLAKTGSDLVLSPFNGNTLVIDGVIYEIPDAGVSLAPSGLGTGTTYYIYAYMNSGTMTLEQSTTAYAVQAGTGVRIKSGDATRTLVGMERATGATTWQGLCRSWFNDPGYTAVTAFTANRTNSSASYAEVNSEIQNPFLVWTSEIAMISAQGPYANSGTGTYFVALTLDGVTTSNAYNAGAFSSGNQEIGFSLTRYASGLSEGYHYATLANKVSSGTITYRGGAADTNERCTIAVYVKK